MGALGTKWIKNVKFNKVKHVFVLHFSFRNTQFKTHEKYSQQ